MAMKSNKGQDIREKDLWIRAEKSKKRAPHAGPMTGSYKKPAEKFYKDYGRYPNARELAKEMAKKRAAKDKK